MVSFNLSLDTLRKLELIRSIGHNHGRNLSDVDIVQEAVKRYLDDLTNGRGALPPSTER